jgi:hypothetical protein
VYKLSQIIYILNVLRLILLNSVIGEVNDCSVNYRPLAQIADNRQQETDEGNCAICGQRNNVCSVKQINEVV